MSKKIKHYPPVRSPRQLGDTIKRIRREQEYSQNELAKYSGLRQAGVSLLEGGAKGVRLESLFKIMATLDIEIVLRKRSKITNQIKMPYEA